MPRRRALGHHLIPAAALEFHEGQQTIWVHSPDGTTILRIKCTGRIRVDVCKGPFVHSDAIVEGDITVCVP